MQNIFLREVNIFLLVDRSDRQTSENTLVLLSNNALFCVATIFRTMVLCTNSPQTDEKVKFFERFKLTLTW